jgi:hypothetical protein
MMPYAPSLAVPSNWPNGRNRFTIGRRCRGLSIIG